MNDEHGTQNLFDRRAVIDEDEISYSNANWIAKFG
jgi:hypothetical protein